MFSKNQSAPSPGSLTYTINNKLEKSNLSNEHALNREPVPLILSVKEQIVIANIYNQSS